MLSIFQLVFLYDVFPTLILSVTATPAFLPGRSVSICAARLGLALKDSLWQGVGARPPSGTASGLFGGWRG